MPPDHPVPRPSSADDSARADDLALAARVAAGDEEAFELLMRSHNRLLYRAARAIVGNSADAEDVVQETYLKAYRALGAFEGRSRLSSWLVRIAVNEALTRAERTSRIVPLHTVANLDGAVADDSAVRASGWIGDARRGPEEAAGDGELRGALSRAVDRLPESLRIVFMLRTVEGLAVEETAECLGLSAEAVRVRLHRARAALREDIDRSVTVESRELFSFGNERCDRVVARVLERTRSFRLPKPD